MISGIQRKSTAVESTYRYFQTLNLITTHFKREADKKKIFELVDKNATLNDFLIAATAVHLYHSAGIKVEHELREDLTSEEATKNLEAKEKLILFNEISLLSDKSLNLEINLLHRKIQREMKFISYCIDERDYKRYNSRDISNIEKDIEKELLEIVKGDYPAFFFYDFVSDTIGLTDLLKTQILEKYSKLKDLSIELESKLERDEKEDKFIESSALLRSISRIQKDFEFKSYRELQVEELPLNKIKKKIFDHYFNYFPISVPALKEFLEANNFKKEIITNIEKYLDQKIHFDDFEEKILNILKKKILEKLSANPNDLVYFIQALNEISFSEVIYLFKKNGVNDILYLMDSSEEKAKQVKKNLIRYNIDKFEIMTLREKNLKNLPEILSSAQINVENLNQKKTIIDRIFFTGMGLIDYSHILLLLNFEDILNNIVREIFYYIFSKIFRPLGRIIELYTKISNERSLFLLALKKMNTFKEQEEWLFIKLEELLIKRIINLQNELVLILNSSNKPFLINGFILARLTESTLRSNIKKLKEEPSFFYKNFALLKLDPEKIFPVSYCISFDIIKRFEEFESNRAVAIQKRLELKEMQKQKKIKEFRLEQKTSTLNWIERRITSTLININKPGFNPTQFYWQEKDIKTATEHIKNHSELQGDSIDLFCQYFSFAIEKIKNFAPNQNLPDDEKIKFIVKSIAENVLTKRLGSSQQDNILIDGDKYEIASSIAIRIGKLFDKILYTKFKEKRKTT
ncbi:MAG: hypothetical protein JW891_04400 [Candidatus Lokiarchaeota archaeon]|nr:hypothetical protein [Candidatus Lokiarchaeota archaeon]